MTSAHTEKPPSYSYLDKITCSALAKSHTALRKELRKGLIPNYTCFMKIFNRNGLFRLDEKGVTKIQLLKVQYKHSLPRYVRNALTGN